MKKRGILGLFFWALAWLAAGNLVFGADWPQWRGPQRNGQAMGETWPQGIGPESLKQTWRLAMGPSYSGPIVAEGKVFVTQTVDEQFEAVHALDRRSGERVWVARWEGAMDVPFFARKNGSWIRSTPAYDDGRLYVAGMRDVLVCLDAGDGAEIWRVDFTRRYGTPLPAFGFVSSPLVDGDHVYVQAGAAVVKLNKRTGESLWRALDDGGGMWGSAFSSPVLAVIDGARQLAVLSRTHIAGLDPDSGQVLWRREIPSYRGMNILTPTIHEGRVFLSNYRGKSYLFDPPAADGAVELLWENKAMAYMSSPVVVDGHVYMHLQNRRVSCIDLASGEERWRSQARFGEYWSMAVQGDRVLALDADGELILFRANPESFELLERRTIADSASWAYLAVAGDQLFVREIEAVAAYDWRDPAP